MSAPPDTAATRLDDALLSRIEVAGINASAPREQRWVDGWLLRLSPGKAKRARCIQAVAPGRLDIDAKLALCVPLFAAAGLRLFVRITPFSPRMNEATSSRRACSSSKATSPASTTCSPPRAHAAAGTRSASVAISSPAPLSAARKSATCRSTLPTRPHAGSIAASASGTATRTTIERRPRAPPERRGEVRR